MKLRLLSTLAFGLAGALHAGPPEKLVWFERLAVAFTESCPLGNGRLGAMVFGGVAEERIVLNETGMWSGSPQDADRPDAYKALPEIRRLLLAGKNAEAEALVNANFTCAGAGSGRGRSANLPYGCYQTLGDLRLKFIGVASDATPQNYRRELDLAEAVARVSYALNGVTFTREIFVSAPDQVIVIRLTASKPGALDFDLVLQRPEHATTALDGTDGLRMTGQLPDGKGGTAGVRYAARVRVAEHDGKLAADGNALQVRGATNVTLLVAALTDIRTFAGRRADDPVAASAGDLARAAGRLASLRADHVADYRRYFGRVDLQLAGTAPALLAKSTPERLRAFADGGSDPALAALFFDFGRYLLISSSRPGGLPANLQGLWAEEIQTPWNADWHLNVNVQMNYWPAEVCGLGELAEPLFAFIASLQMPGAKTARSYYGARGWVAHVLANPWGFTAPGEQASWGASNDGSAWLCQHLWDHYLFTHDDTFLARAYPILKGSAQFYLDSPIEEPSHRWLVTAPSNSPENSFRLPDGKTAHICMGPTVDQQMLRYLFNACIRSSEILGIDPEFRRELEARLPRLAPTRIGSDGRVMEWLEEYPEPEPSHRHVSHLWGLYPGDEISAQTTSALMDAARKTLETRGDAGTGWSLAFKLNLWARLRDGDRCERILRTQLKPVSVASQGIAVRGGGTYPNLFDAHPPFQIDGNFGATAGVAEMLLQSHAGDGIRLLPALPRAWSSGAVSGLQARPNTTVDLTWENGRLASAVLRAKEELATVVILGERVVPVKLAAGESVRLDGELRRVR